MAYDLTRHRPAPRFGWPRLLLQLDAVLRRWQQLADERRQLAALDERLLKDIGVSRCDAIDEARRRCWDDPHRRRWF